MSQEKLPRICHVNFAKGLRGGEKQTALLVEQLAELGYSQQLIIRHDSPLVEEVRQIPNLELSFLRKPYWLSLMLRTTADLFHAHEAKAAQWVYLKSRITKIPYIIMRRILKLPNNNFLTNRVYQQAAVVVAVSQVIAAGLRLRFGFSEVPVIHDMCAAYPLDQSHLKKLKQRYENKFVIGHIGALDNRDKGQEYLIETAKHLQEQAPGIHILLLGDGPDAKTLKHQAQGLSNIEFLGFQTDIGTYLNLFDMFVFPSLREGLGSILLDALQAGKSIVATKVGGIPDVIHDQENGLLVPAADSDALTGAILRLYQDSDLRHKLERKAVEDAQKYQASNIVQHYVSLYRRMNQSLS